MKQVVSERINPNGTMEREWREDHESLADSGFADSRFQRIR
jgi:hypothetical protein